MPPIVNTLSPFDEMLAYEALASREPINKVSRRLAQPGLLPSRLARQEQIPESELEAVKRFLLTKSGFTVCFRGAYQYPDRLEDADHPVRLFYARGDLCLLESRCISVVGTRKISPEGSRRAKRLSTELVNAGFTIVSGLATGVDTEALQSAIDRGGHVIGVLGTPIDEFYPKKNRPLQEEIMENHLLLSQVPFYRYHHEPFRVRRFYFPMRNETMSALSEATVIVEASDTSGTLIQARACLKQRRRLFILDSCFKNPELSWPQKFADAGAIRVHATEDILSALGERPQQSPWPSNGKE